MTNRRNFLKTIGGIAIAAAVPTWPFRVYSFPSQVKVTTPIWIDSMPVLASLSPPPFLQVGELFVHYGGIRWDRVLYAEGQILRTDRDVRPPYSMLIRFPNEVGVNE